MKNKTNIFEKAGNILLFKGNLNRLGFLVMMALTQFIYLQMLHLIFDCIPGYCRGLDFCIWVLFCYLWGICIAGRLRNLKLNPSLAYLFVVALWWARYVFLRYSAQPIFQRVEYMGMVTLFILLPLFAKDKETLQFWKSPK